MRLERSAFRFPLSAFRFPLSAFLLTLPALYSVSTHATQPGLPSAVETEILLHEIAPQGRHTEIECRARSRVGALPNTELRLMLPADARLTAGVDRVESPLSDTEASALTARVVFTESGIKEVGCIAASTDGLHHGGAAIEYLDIGPDGGRIATFHVDPNRPLSVVWPDGPDVVRLPSEESYPAPHRSAPPPDAPADLIRGLPFSEANIGHPSRRSLYMTINGRFQFIGADANPTSEVALVEIVNPVDNNVLHSCYTAVDGYYSCGPFTLPSGNFLRVRWAPYAIAYGDTIMVLNPTLGTDEKVNNTWSFTTGNIYTPSNGTHNIGTYVVTDDTQPTGTRSAFIIYKDLIALWRYILNEAGIYESPVQTAGSGIAEFRVGQNGGNYYDFFAYHLKFDGTVTLFSDVIQHEYAHAIMYQLYYPYYPNTLNCNPHFLWAESSPGCAWAEGWAEYLPLLSDHSPIYSALSGSANLELPTWGTPGWDNGSAVEGRVAGALWDLLDAVPDGYDQYTDLNIRRIWRVFHDDKPLTFQAFIDAWIARGYPVSGPANALYQNTIQ